MDWTNVERYLDLAVKHLGKIPDVCFIVTYGFYSNWSKPHPQLFTVKDPTTGELKEETGLEAAEMTRLGTLWIAYGFTRQKQHVFLATGLTETAREPDAEEHDLVVRSVSIEKFEEMMRGGEIRDGCTLAAWGLYSLWKAKKG